MLNARHPVKRLQKILLEVETLWDNSGATRDGYVDTGELAYEMIENEMK